MKNSIYKYTISLLVAVISASASAQPELIVGDFLDVRSGGCVSRIPSNYTACPGNGGDKLKIEGEVDLLIRVGGDATYQVERPSGFQVLNRRCPRGATTAAHVEVEWRCRLEDDARCEITRPGWCMFENADRNEINNQ